MRPRRRLRGARRRDALPLRPLHLAVERGRQRRARRLDDDRRARGPHDDAPLRDARLPRHLPAAGAARQRGGDGRSRLGGRIELGLGAGWMEREHRAFGFPFPETPVRMAMFAEQLEIVHRLWTEERVDFAASTTRSRTRPASRSPSSSRIRRCSSAAAARAAPPSPPRASPTSTTRRSPRRRTSPRSAARWQPPASASAAIPRRCASRR